MRLPAPPALPLLPRQLCDLLGRALPPRKLNAKPRAAFVTRRHLWGAAHPHWAQGRKPGVARSVEGKCRGRDRSALRQSRKVPGRALRGRRLGPRAVEGGHPPCPSLFVQGRDSATNLGFRPTQSAAFPVLTQPRVLSHPGRLSLGASPLESISTCSAMASPCPPQGPQRKALSKRDPPKVTKLENRPTFLVWGRWEHRTHPLSSALPSQAGSGALTGLPKGQIER